MMNTQPIITKPAVPLRSMELLHVFHLIVFWGGFSPQLHSSGLLSSVSRNSKPVWSSACQQKMRQVSEQMVNIEEHLAANKPDNSLQSWQESKTELKESEYGTHQVKSKRILMLLCICWIFGRQLFGHTFPIIRI